MLTAELVRARTVKGQVRPTFVNPEDAELQERTRELIALVRQGVGEPRGELEELIDQWIGDDPQAKLLRGLWHLLERRCSFTVHSPVPPPELRVAVFREASAKGPLAELKIEGGALTAEDIYRSIGEQHGVDPALLPDALYADLESEQRVTACEIEDEDWNLAGRIVQGRERAGGVGSQGSRSRQERKTRCQEQCAPACQATRDEVPSADGA